MGATGSSHCLSLLGFPAGASCAAVIDVLTTAALDAWQVNNPDEDNGGGDAGMGVM